MTQTTDPPLGGYEQRLLDELVTFVELRAAAPVTGMRPAPRPCRVALAPRLAVAAAVAVAVCVGALIAGSASSGPDLAQALPVFGRPATPIAKSALAQILRDNGAGLRDARLDVRHARAFPTPLGTGYVVADRGAHVICLAAPGFSLGGDGPASWAATCSAAGPARREGIGGLVAFGTVGQAAYVEILPRGASATAVSPGRPARALTVRDGVVAILVHRPTTLTIHVDARAITTVIRPPVRSPRVSVPTRAQVATRVRFQISGRGLSAVLRTRFGVRAGDTAYVLEYAPVPGTRPRCPGLEQPGDVIDEQTVRTIAAGTRLTLRGGAPDCAGRWRIAVYVAAARGETHYPGQAWAQPLDGAATAPAGSADRIVGERVLVLPSTSTR